MKIIEKGVLQKSEIFFHIPSEFAKKALYCLHDSGLFYCDDRYIVERNHYNNYRDQTAKYHEKNHFK